MLEVQKYLKQSCAALSPLESLSRLQEATGVKNSIYEDVETGIHLVVLNYCQIDSDKRSQVSQECRSLVLEMGTWEVVSRSFDRFFNYGEEPCPALNPTFLVAMEKVDGSLIGLFRYKNIWLYRTRSVIMPSGQINGWDVTWDQHIEDALGFDYAERLGVFTDVTFIFELTSMENRVVTKYASNSPTMTLLAVRDHDGHYGNEKVREYVLGGNPEWRGPRTYSFDTMTECLTAAKELRNLEEGFVMYNRDGKPVSKVKNPAYVAAHHLRGEGLNPKRIKDLIIMNEVTEYLAIFPEDTKAFWPYQDAYSWLIQSIREKWRVLCIDPLTQKEFALKILDLPYKGILFSLRKGLTIQEAWDKCSTNNKYQLIDAMMQRNISGDKL